MKIKTLVILTVCFISIHIVKAQEAPISGCILTYSYDALATQNATLSNNNWTDIIHGKANMNAIGGSIYNEVMAMTWDDISDPHGKYSDQIFGAAAPLITGLDFSSGAYFWNASSPAIGFNWNQYYNGRYQITDQIGSSTFFRYTNPNKTWP
jgi:hypothetical protein